MSEIIVPAILATGIIVEVPMINFVTVALAYLSSKILIRLPTESTLVV